MKICSDKVATSANESPNCGAPQLHSYEQIWCCFPCIPIAKILSIVCNCNSNFHPAGLGPRSWQSTFFFKFVNAAASCPHRQSVLWLCKVRRLHHSRRKVRRLHHSQRKPQPAPFLQRLHPPQANLTKMLNDEPTMTCIVSLSAWRKNLQKQDTAGKPVKHTRSCGSWRMRNQRLKQPKPKPENSARFCVLVAAQPKC